MTSLVSILAATAGGTSGGTAPGPRLVLSPSVNLVFDGNSITNDHLASGLDDLVAARLTTLGKLNGASVSTGGGLGVNGQTWTDMRTSSADLAAAWVAGKTNVLICGETTNSVFGGGRSATQCIVDASAYLATAAGQHPWIILLWGSIPRGHGNEGTYPGENAKNVALLDVDAYMAANYASMGAHGYVSVRSGVPMFDHDGSAATSFSTYQAGWNEAPPSTLGWDSLGWVHPNDGTWPAGSTPGTGKKAIAAKIADALADLPATP